jgi:hypothetical protein
MVTTMLIGDVAPPATRWLISEPVPNASSITRMIRTVLIRNAAASAMAVTNRLVIRRTVAAVPSSGESQPGSIDASKKNIAAPTGLGIRDAAVRNGLMPCRLAD